MGGQPETSEKLIHSGNFFSCFGTSSSINNTVIILIKDPSSGINKVFDEDNNPVGVEKEKEYVQKFFNGTCG